MLRANLFGPFVVFSCLLAAACSDNATGSSSGGSAGAGASGSAGAAGSAGATGGAGGSAAGAGGTAAGAGGTVAGSAGTGGTAAGSAGAGGTGGGPAGGFADIVPEALYEQMFPHRNALFSYAALSAAASAFPGLCSEGAADDRKRECAAFLANISHETTGGWPQAPDGPYAWGLYFTQEVGCEMGACTWYCDAGNVQYPCAPGKTYHGRGPIQLSWNYNYGQAGDALSLPLLTDPDLVANDGVISFKTGVWFWMTPQPPKPSCHDVMTGKWTPSAQDTAAGRVPGFGMTINIINGGIECNKPTPSQVDDRVGFYQRYAQILGVDPGPNLYCDQMASF